MRGRLAASLLAAALAVFGQKPELVLQTGPLEAAMALAFSPDGTMLAALGAAGNVCRIYAVASGSELVAVETGSQGMTGMSGTLRFSQDGRALWTLVNGAFRQFESRTGKLEKSLNLPSGERGLASWQISADGRIAFASGIGLESPPVLDLESGQARTLPVAIQGVSNDGRLAVTDPLAEGGMGRMGAPVDLRYRFQLVELASGRMIGGFEPLPPIKNLRSSQLFQSAAMKYAGPGTFRFSADARRVARVGQADAGMSGSLSIHLFDVASGKALGEATVTHGRPPGSGGLHGGEFLASLNPDLTLAAAAGKGSEVVLVSLPGGTTAASFSAGSAEVVALAFSADGKMLATVGADHSIGIWDASAAAKGTVTRIRGMGESALPVHALEFTRDGSRLVVGTSQSVNAWELTNGTATRTLSVPFEPPRTQSAIWEGGRFNFLSNDGMRVGALEPQKVTVWDARSGLQLAVFAPRTGMRFRTGSLSSSGDLLMVFDSPDYAEQAAKATPATTAFSMRSMSRNRKEVMNYSKLMQEMMKAVDKGDQKKMGQIEQKARKELPKEYADAVSAMRGVLTQTAQAKVTPQGEARLLRVSTGEVLWRAPASGYSHSATAISDDGRWLAMGEGSQALDPSSPQTCRLALMDRKAGGEAAAVQIDACTYIAWTRFSPDGRNLAVVYGGLYSGAQAKLWQVGEGQLTPHPLTLPIEGQIGWASFSPDGKQLAVTALNGATRVIDVEGGAVRMKLPGHRLGVPSVAFSPDGKLIATGSQDAATQIWDAASGENLASLVSLNEGSDWLVVTPDGLFDGTPAAWKQILWRFSERVADVAPVEAYFTEFYYPGLLGEIVGGKRPKAPAGVEQKDRRQPVVRLAAQGQGRTRTVQVTIGEPEAGVGARDARLFRNGTLVKLWRGDVLKGQREVTLEAVVPVVAGENAFTAYAFNRDSIKSPDAALVVQGEAALARKGVARVLAVGVNQYANSDYNLKFAVADATAFSAEVRAQQSKLDRYERVEITTLLDAQATKARVLESLHALAAQAQPEDAVVLYFAGHGVARGPRFYLVPHDLGYRGQRTGLNASGLETIVSHSISDVELESAVEGLDAEQLVLVIDACNSGQALESEEKRRGPMNSKGLAQLAYEKGMYILTAAQSYQAALEAAALGHGYLTFALVEEGLKKGAADFDSRDGQVLAREWFNYAAARVPEMQEKEMQTRLLVFVEGEEAGRKSTQKPRLFYRRDGEARPFVIGRP